MKCARENNGMVKRVSDEEARDLVENGEAKYVARNVWKKEVRSPVNSDKCQGKKKKKKIDMI